jgi:hypothetical protein
MRRCFGVLGCRSGWNDEWTIWEGRKGRNTVGACYDTHAVLRKYKSFFEKALYPTGCENGVARGRLSLPVQLILSHHSSFILSDV